MNSPKKAITVRRMRKSDAKLVAKMMRKLAVLHGDKPKTSGRHFTKYTLGQTPLSMAWIAYAGKIPAGFAVAYDWMNFVRGKPTRTLDLLFVDEEYRGRGIGAALIKATAADACAKGISRVMTSANNGNKAAQKYYCRLGFTEHAITHKKYVLEGKALAKSLGKKS